MTSPLFDFRLRYDKSADAWQQLAQADAKALFDEALRHIDALQDRIDALPDEACEACGAVSCCCAYDWPAFTSRGSRRPRHRRRPSTRCASASSCSRQCGAPTNGTCS